MAHVPNQAIFRCVENVMQRNRQLNRAQIRRKVSAGGGHRINDKFAQLDGKCRQISAIHFAQIGGIGNWIEERIFCGCCHNVNFLPHFCNMTLANY